MSSTTARLVLTAVLMTGVVVGAGALTGSAPEGRGAVVAGGTTSAGPAAQAAALPGASILGAWDRKRAAAWAAGDVRRLGALYTPGSVSGERDQEMLREWLRRGLVIRDLRVQVLAVRELRRTARTLVLRVTDRVSAGTAVGRGASRPLPRDSATTTTVTLRRLRGHWLVESVRPARS